jgi:hypothetical protein
MPFVYIHQNAKEKSFKGFIERNNRIENGKMLAIRTVNNERKKWE